ncbi:hypothetical protein AAG570_012740 [Ranatra chinensis]|uniref:Glucose-methanol-choline oxidoreductase N-terminal domain-containing protein n=1 Tax=Ranatra chinensis TaxID=642074 RepID=A0ABD0YEQ0_9HEMI
MMWSILQCILLMALLMVPQSETQYPALTESAIRFLMEGINYSAQEPKDVRNMLKEYDFIIVGAGSAGCVVANRLTEVPEWKVLLIEAGDSESYLMDIPVLANMLQFSQANWKYKAVPNNRSCLGLENKQCNIPRGKVMGGSSVLNYMIMTRGNRRDYDNWAQLGNIGWSYDDVLPYFKKSENMLVEKLAKDKVYHNTGGYQAISQPPFRTPIAEAFVQGGKELGLDEVDYNGATQTGFAFFQTSQKNGTRCSTNRAFLHPIRSRKNLHVKKLSQVVKILIDPNTKTAYGVEFVRRGRKYAVRARREVILSAGAINSPQILMLSGIGPKDHLTENSIPTLQDLPVGYNLQDHNALGGLTFLVDQPVSVLQERILNNANLIDEFARYHKGIITVPGGCEALAFIDLDDPYNRDGYPNLELLFIGGTLSSEPTLRKNFGIRKDIYDAVYKQVEHQDGYMIFPMVMRPKSRGRVMLRNRDPMSSPLIDMGYFTHPEDLEIIVKGVEWAVLLSNTTANKKLGSRLLETKLPACSSLKFNTPAYWRCHAKQITLTIYHQSGTCKMGPQADPTSVVNPRLQVKGIKRLRVVDASIIPFIPAAHTNQPVIMIAEKASDMIKEDNY